jgi:hypothetical protein
LAVAVTAVTLNRDVGSLSGEETLHGETTSDDDYLMALHDGVHQLLYLFECVVQSERRGCFVSQLEDQVAEIEGPPSRVLRSVRA